MTLTKNLSENNYSKIYLNYDFNRTKRDIQNNILQVYIIIQSIIHNWCQT